MDRYDFISYWPECGADMEKQTEGEYALCEDVVAKLSPIHEKIEDIDELGDDEINEMSIGQLQRTLKKYDKLMTEVHNDLEVMLGELI